MIKLIEGERDEEITKYLRRTITLFHRLEKTQELITEDFAPLFKNIEKELMDKADFKAYCFYLSSIGDCDPEFELSRDLLEFIRKNMHNNDEEIRVLTLDILYDRISVIINNQKVCLDSDRHYILELNRRFVKDLKSLLPDLLESFKQETNHYAMKFFIVIGSNILNDDSPELLDYKEILKEKLKIKDLDAETRKIIKNQIERVMPLDVEISRS